MKNRILLSLASVLCACLLTGCISGEVQNPHQRCFCWTDGIASWGQDIYFGRYDACWGDGHAVPVTFPEHCDYQTGYSTSMNTNVTVSGNANVAASATVTHN
jgi:hypothetical protein